MFVDPKRGERGVAGGFGTPPKIVLDYCTSWNLRKYYPIAKPDIEYV
jgi:hypothetical protein